MIAGETPVLFSKACELFIIELAYKSWVHTLESNRRTLQVKIKYIY
jgi:nuclear transcription factor Y gamma